MHVLATRETGEIMKIRFGAEAAGRISEAVPGKAIRVNDVTVTFAPAGHILGSAQIQIVHQGRCAVVSGDYKRTADPTCVPFELVKCDLFITEATFGLPVFCHEPPDKEVARLLGSLAANPDRAHLLGVYGLGKCQRVIVMLRKAGYDAPIYLHGALVALCSLYERLGINLGELRSGARAGGAALPGSPRPVPALGDCRSLGAALRRSRSSALLRAGCGCGSGPASVGRSCRSSSPIMPIGPSFSTPFARRLRKTCG